MPKDKKLLHEDEVGRRISTRSEAVSFRFSSMKIFVWCSEAASLNWSSSIRFQLGTLRTSRMTMEDLLRSSAQDDLRRATKLAFAQIKQYGMSKTIGLISFPADQQNPQNDDISGWNRTANVYNAWWMRWWNVLTSAYHQKQLTRTSPLLGSSTALGQCFQTHGEIDDGKPCKTWPCKLKRRYLIIGMCVKHLLFSFLLQLAEELLKRETLNYEDIVKLIGPPPFPNKQKLDIIDWDDTGRFIPSLRSSPLTFVSLFVSLQFRHLTRAESHRPPNLWVGQVKARLAKDLRRLANPLAVISPRRQNRKKILVSLSLSPHRTSRWFICFFLHFLAHKSNNKQEEDKEISQNVMMNDRSRSNAR